MFSRNFSKGTSLLSPSIMLIPNLIKTLLFL